MLTIQNSIKLIVKKWYNQTYKSLTEVASLIDTFWSQHNFIVEENSGALSIPMLKFIFSQRALER
jgi:hypothetical protein